MKELIEEIDELIRNQEDQKEKFGDSDNIQIFEGRIEGYNEIKTLIIKHNKS